MESSGFSQKKWKYLSFALMGILAAGVLTQPQAFALTDSQLKKKFDEIWAAINGLKEKDTNLQNQINTIQLTPGPKGEDGQDGTDGIDGQDGSNGLNCWDLNGDGAHDETEDINNDGSVNVLDCKGEPGKDGSDGQDADVSALEARIDELDARVLELEGGGPGDTECTDLIDNDGDGHIDSDDIGCGVTNGASETGTTQCSDGLDNDSDGYWDYDGAGHVVVDHTFPIPIVVPVPDLACASASDDDESS